MSTDIQNFYGSLASDYDAMTNFEQRVQKEQKIFQKWVERFSINTVLDAACGTGLHAIVLSQLGVNIIGADISVEMLDEARKNAKNAGEEIRWIQSPMQQLSQKISDKFDAVFCLGNSLPHLTDEKDLKAVVKGFSERLHPDGILVLQILNYNKILNEKNRIVNIKRNEKHEFIRFYDFLEDLIRFNILRIQWEGNNPVHHQLVSTELMPYLKDQLFRVLQNKGFRDIETFGNMTFDPFLENESSNLVMVAKKSR